MAAVGEHEILQWVREQLQGDWVGFNRALRVFATGFQRVPISWPCIQNDCFKISLEDIVVNNKGNSFLLELVQFYDWGEVMKMILEATRGYTELVDIELEVQDKLSVWLTTFQGWGLLSHVIPFPSGFPFQAALLYTQAHWDEATRGRCTELAVFNHVKDFYDSQALHEVPAVLVKTIGALIPDLLVLISEMESEDPDVSFKGDERKKSLDIIFGCHSDIEVYFVLEKKRVNGCLVDLAAEAVAKELEHMGCIKELEIPRTLMDDVYVKFKDWEWIRQHWEFIEQDEPLLLESTWDHEEESVDETCSDQHKESEEGEVLPAIEER